MWAREGRGHADWGVLATSLSTLPPATDATPAAGKKAPGTSCSTTAETVPFKFKCSVWGGADGQTSTWPVDVAIDQAVLALGRLVVAARGGAQFDVGGHCMARKKARQSVSVRLCLGLGWRAGLGGAGQRGWCCRPAAGGRGLPVDGSYGSGGLELLAISPSAGQGPGGIGEDQARGFPPHAPCMQRQLAAAGTQGPPLAAARQLTARLPGHQDAAGGPLREVHALRLEASHGAGLHTPMGWR